MSKSDEHYMEKALALAQMAYSEGDVPVGAIVVDSEGRVIGEGYNQKEQWQDPTLHGELIAIKRACLSAKTWRLSGCTLYTTLEPCPMCAGAIVQARIAKLVIGAVDPKGGGVLSKYHIGQDHKLNHSVQVINGCLESQCSMLLKKFFKTLRHQKNKNLSHEIGDY